MALLGLSCFPNAKLCHVMRLLPNTLDPRRVHLDFSAIKPIPLGWQAGTLCISTPLLLRLYSTTLSNYFCQWCISKLAPGIDKKLQKSFSIAEKVGGGGGKRIAAGKVYRRFPMKTQFESKFMTSISSRTVRGWFTEIVTRIKLAIPTASQVVGCTLLRAKAYKMKQ